MRELRQSAFVRAREKTIFSAAFSHPAKARSRGPASSSSATAGQNEQKRW
jgi:hypothetical protein